MNDYLLKMILEHFIPTMFSTLGVFVLTLFVMYIHYRIIKSFYKKILPKEKESAQKHKERTEYWQKKMDILLNGQYENSQKYELASILYGQISENERSLWKEELNISQWEKYSFYRYLVNILNWRFPQT